MASIESTGTPVISQTGLISIGAAAKLAGCHINSLRKYANTGQLACYRAMGGKRRFKICDIEEFFQISSKEEIVGGKRIIIMARVSDGRRSTGFSKGETSDLQRQVDRLKEYAANEYGETNPIVLAETGSGLSFQRKQLNRLIDGLLNGEYRDSILLLTHPERLARIGRELIEKIANFANCKIIYTEREETLDGESSPGELIAEFCSSVISRIYAKRSSDRYKKRLSPQVLSRIVALRESGLPHSKISAIVNSEGLRCEDGAAVGISTVRKYLNEKVELERRKENSIEQYFAQCIQKGASNLRLKKEDLYADYEQWCKDRGLNPISPHHVGRILKIMGIESTVIPDKQTGTKLVWKAIVIRQNEKLSIPVKEKPQKPLKTDPKKENTSFTQFYAEHLRGKFRGYSRDLWAAYKSWCKANGKRPESFRTIPRQLLDLGGHFSQKFGTGGLIYDLTVQMVGRGLPQVVIWCLKEARRRESE